jgi:hypothetical protein
MNRLSGPHTNEVFSCQHIPHCKNVLRLHLAEDGTLTMYPIGAPTVKTNWKLQSEAKPPKSPWFDAENLFGGWIFSRDTAVDVHERGPNEPCSGATG